MKNIIKALVGVFAVVVLSGCAAGLDKKATAIDWTKGSVIVMSVELDNQYKPSHQPTHLGVVMMRKASSDPRERIPALGATPAGRNAFLVTSQIQPGRYTIARIFGMSQRFPIQGGIDFAVDAPFEVAPNTITYLGRVASINKERINRDDQSTGGVIPLIDQAVSGYGGGTLEVVLKDTYEEDVKLLKSEFVYVQNIDVVRNPLRRMML
ncbi:MAG: hypothetical protein JWQ72_3044, partial [Polaromonas sp.]|nr:hypothetical protein [Polaromonas sp.]